MIYNQKYGTSHVAGALVVGSLLLAIALYGAHLQSSYAQPTLPRKDSASNSSTPSKSPVSTSNVTKNVVFNGKSVKIFVIGVGGLYGGAGLKSLDNFLTMNPGYEIKYIVPKQGSNATVYFFIVEVKH
jgi:hypothetical protein